MSGAPIPIIRQATVAILTAVDLPDSGPTIMTILEELDRADLYDVISDLVSAFRGSVKAAALIGGFDPQERLEIILQALGTVATE